MKYLILYGHVMEALEASVSECLKEGWVCQGGVVVTDQGFYQSVVWPKD